MTSDRDKKYSLKIKVIFILLLCLITLSSGFLARKLINSHLLSIVNSDAFYRYFVVNMTPDEKKELYGFLVNTMPGSIYEAVPEPSVARVLQFGQKKMSRQAEIISNQAGMRSSREFVSKPDNRFRILCVGDSMVMGTGGREEDRWGNQIEEYLTQKGITVEGRQIEVYNIGVGGWSIKNAASYLSHRISGYDPDLVLVMLVVNDLSDNPGVMGIGQATFNFTPDHRHLGSGVISDHWPTQFGVFASNLLFADLGPESRTRWKEAFAALKRLEDLIMINKGNMVVGVLRAHPLFEYLCSRYHKQTGLISPLFVTDYMGNRLAHDIHPDRKGNSILASHYLHVLSKHNLLPLAENDLPTLHNGLSVDSPVFSRQEKLELEQKKIVQENLDEDISFNRLSHKTVTSFLGGIYPGSAANKLNSFPFGTLKSVFLLKKKATAPYVSVEIETEAYPELYPFELELFVQGVKRGNLILNDVSEAGRHAVTGAIPKLDEPYAAIEIKLLTTSYWTTINDFTMKSYRLISVKQHTRTNRNDR